VEVPGDTVEGVRPRSTGEWSAWLRRSLLVVLAVVVVTAGTGVLGVWTSTASASRDGYDLSLRYPHVARAGLDTQWQVTVHHAGGFSKPVALAVTGDYFDIFETQGFHPDASKSTRDGRWLYLTFDPPPGDTFVVDFDAYIQPSSQRGRTAEVRVLDGQVPLVSVPFRTWLLP
jgi:hypothetical protein